MSKSFISSCLVTSTHAGLSVAENSRFLPAWLASIICKTSPRVKMTAQFWLSPKAAQDAARSRRSTAVPPASWYGDGWRVIVSRNDGLRMRLVCTLCSLEHWSDCFILVADHCWLQMSKTTTHPDLSRGTAKTLLPWPKIGNPGSSTPRKSLLHMRRLKASRVGTPF